MKRWELQNWLAPLSGGKYEFRILIRSDCVLCYGS